MRKILFTLCALFISIGCFAQSGAEDGGVSIDLGTFTGIVALVSLIATQIAKLAPAINSKALYKILVSVGTGILVCVGSWLLQIAPPLSGLPIGQVLIYGLASGLTGCGFYDVIKAIGKLFNKEV